jgi:hypothetical protein
VDHLRALRVLGLPPGSSQDDIKTAWRDLAKVWHPDRFQHDERLQTKAGENLGRINEAYESLRDYDPDVSPKFASRVRESVAIIFGMGELGEAPMPTTSSPPHEPFMPRAPIGLRKSLRVLGLGRVRRTGEIGSQPNTARSAWLALAVLVIILFALLIPLLGRIWGEP